MCCVCGKLNVKYEGILHHSVSKRSEINVLMQSFLDCTVPWSCKNASLTGPDTWQSAKGPHSTLFWPRTTHLDRRKASEQHVKQSQFLWFIKGVFYSFIYFFKFIWTVKIQNLIKNATKKTSEMLFDTGWMDGYTLKNKGSSLVQYVWFLEEPLTPMEAFHCTKGSL